MWDVFISYASEDKDAVARPLANALIGAGLRVWLDEHELKLGDSLRAKIDQGLAGARFGVVVLSKAFFSKEWPQLELNGLAAREVKGAKVILPVWHDVDRDFIAQYSPTLADKVGVRSSQGFERISSDILIVVGNTNTQPHSDPHHRPVSGTPAGVLKETRGGTQRGSINDESLKYPVSMFLDHSEDAFLKHLSSHNVVWIVGITNEHLVTYLERAYALRDEKPWDEIRIIFQARHLLQHFGDGEKDRVQDWEAGVQRTLQFFLQSGSQKARKLDIRHSSRILPFVGQFYDYCHVRVAFLLHVPDIHTGSYLNYTLSKSSVNTEDVPDQQQMEHTLKFEQYRALQYAFEDLRNASTPLLTANVIGECGNDGSFIFRSLIPQNNWRHYRDVLQDRPAHLVTFVLLHDRDRIFLQYRDENNSRGQTKTYGVVPGKVNDEDCFQLPPEQRYWGEIYEMQKAFDGIESGGRKWQEANAACRRASDAFARATGIRVGASVLEPQLLELCRRSACRYLDEKLGLDIPGSRLTPMSRNYFVAKQEYTLYVKLFALRVKPEELEGIRMRRPFANLRAFDLERFQTLRKDRKLTMFLEQNFEDVLLFLQGASHPRTSRKRADV